MRERISAVVLNYNQPAATARACAILRSSRDVEVDVLIVDATPTPTGAAGLEEAAGPGRILRLAENRGYAGGMNAGLAFWADREPNAPVLLLTPDAVPDSDTAAQLLAALKAHPRVAIVGPVVAYGAGPGARIAAGGRVHPGRAHIRPIRRVLGDEPYDTEWVEGCCMLLRLESVRAGGGFDETYFLYFEEVDLCCRLRAAGWKVRVAPDARVLHPKESGGSPPHYFYYMTRNAYRFWRRIFGIRGARPAVETLRATVWLGLVVCGSLVLPWRWSEVPRRWRDFRLQAWGAWAGTRDHVRGRYGPYRATTQARE